MHTDIHNKEKSKTIFSLKTKKQTVILMILFKLREVYWIYNL